MDQQQLAEILEKHRKWLNGDKGGERANLQRANLQRAHLQRANLQRAHLQRANLESANLWGANLWGANLWGAHLQRANLQRANLQRAHLQRANLEGANLWGANLRGANLQCAIGNMVDVKSLQIETYSVTYTADRLQIGCQNHSFDEWRDFTDEEILEMDGRTALKFWRKWKDQLFAIIEMSPAEPTGCNEDETND